MVFSQALAEIVRRLDHATREGLLRGYGLIGGFAVSVWGVPRATHDIDFAIVPAEIEPDIVASRLKGTYSPGSADDPLAGVIHALVAIEGRTIPIQLIFLPARWSPLILEHVNKVTVLGCSVPVVSWSLLLLLKLYAGGPKDLLDAHELFTVHQPNADEVAGLESLAKSLTLSAELQSFLKQTHR
jgi:hypothetical protein